MYIGNNPKALRSRDWLLDSFFALLSQKKYEDITIKDICLRADLSRQTFYQIFSSKEEMIQYRFSLFFEEYQKNLQNADIDCENLEAILCMFFENVKKEACFIQFLIENNFVHIIAQSVKEFLDSNDYFCFNQLSSSKNDFMHCYVAGAISYMILNWFEKDLNVSVQELSNLTLNLLKGKYFSEVTE